MPMTESEKDAKISELTAEVQRLLAEKVELQTENSKLRFELAGIQSLPGGSRRDSSESSKFENMRMETKYRTELHERSREVEQLRVQISDQQDELERLRCKIAAHNDQVSASLGGSKKKRGWWGTSKKSKHPSPSPTFILGESDLHIIGDQTEGDGGGKTSRTASFAPDGGGGYPTNVSASNIQNITQKYQEKIEQLRSRVLELEREHAKADAEVELLERERRNLHDKVGKLQATCDSLRTQQKLYNESDRIPSTKSLMVHIPSDGMDDSEKWQMIVRIQEAALQKEATQKEEFIRQIDALTMIHGSPKGQNKDASAKTKRDIDQMYHNICALKEQNNQMQLGIKEASLKEEYLNSELKRCRAALADMIQLMRNRRRTDDKSDKEYVHMLSTAIGDAEHLHHSLREQRSKNLEHAKSMYGEIRNLRQGRTGKMEGQPPVNTVYPSPNGQMMVLRHHERSNSVSSYSSTESTESSDHNRSSMPKYHYEWCNGQYVLKEGSLRNAQEKKHEDTMPEHWKRSYYSEGEDIGQLTLLGEPNTKNKDRIIAENALRTWNEDHSKRKSTKLVAEKQTRLPAFDEGISKAARSERISKPSHHRSPRNQPTFLDAGRQSVPVPAPGSTEEEISSRDISRILSTIDIEGVLHDKSAVRTRDTIPAKPPVPILKSGSMASKGSESNRLKLSRQNTPELGAETFNVHSSVRLQQAQPPRITREESLDEIFGKRKEQLGDSDFSLNPVMDDREKIRFDMTDMPRARRLESP